MKKTIGLAGTGHLGRIHIKCLVEEGHGPELAIYDTDLDRAHELGKEYDVEVCDSYADLLTRSEVIIVVTPTSTHHALALQAIQAGKHLFIEKPVTETSAQGRELMEVASQKKLVIQIGHVERFNPAFVAYESKGLSPKFIESHRLSTYNPRGTDVSVVMDLMIHDLDLLLYVVGSEVVEVRATGVPLISPTEDICNARLGFANGAVANVTASRVSMKQMRKMRLFQPEAYATLDFIDKQLQLYRMADDLPVEEGAHSFDLETSIGHKKVSVYIPDLDETNAIKDEHKHFLQSVDHKEPAIVSLSDGVRAVELAEWITAEMRSVSDAWK